MGILDGAVFIAFIVTVLLVGMIKSRDEGDNSEEYFLAGRGLKWWLIGISLIAANISAEQFVGMSGSAAGPLGLAIASYEWIAAVTLVVVAFAFLPYFLRSGIFTIPQFLEYRYNHWARTLMALFMLIILIAVSLSGVIYAGSLTMQNLLAQTGVEFELASCCWFMGIIAALYVGFGGLKACAWADLIQGTALIVAGGIITWLALEHLGAMPVGELVDATGAVPTNLGDATSGLERLWALNEPKLHMVLPKTDENIPWTALVIGLWIPNFYYWGLNQYIVQRMLGSASLKEGQKGIVFAAVLKLIIPFIIVFPGLMAFNMFSGDMDLYEADSALGLLIGNLVPKNGLYGFIIAALLGAIISSLAAVLNAASTIFTMDIFGRYINKKASQHTLVKVGRISVAAFVVIGCIISPQLANPKFGGIFAYIQMMQGFISPGILAVFIYGLLNRTSQGVVGVIGLLVNPIIYGALTLWAPQIAFLDRMAICLALVLMLMTIIGLFWKLDKPVEFKSETTLDLESSRSAKVAGIGVVVMTLILYVIFW